MNEALFISYIDNFEIYDKYLHMGWEEILDTSIYDREYHCMKYELRSFEESEIHLGFGNQRIESCDYGNH